MNTNCESDCPVLRLENEENDDDYNEEILNSNEHIQFSLWDTFKPHLPRLLVTAIVDAVLPFIIYLILKGHVNIVHALLAAGIPPLCMIIIKGIISRTFDALGFLVFTAFLASAIVALITNNPTVILLEKSIVTGLTSLIFGITLIPLSFCHHKYQLRPLAYYIYQDLIPTKRIHVGLPDILFEDEEEFIELEENGLVRQLTQKQEVTQVYEWIYAHCPSFRSTCYIITIIWTVGLVLECLARLFLMLIDLTPNQVFIYSHILLTIMTNILIILTIICIRKERKQTLKFINNWKKDFLYNQSDISIINIST